MSGLAWLELLCRHIPDRYEHFVRYVGWYSNRARGVEKNGVSLTPCGLWALALLVALVPCFVFIMSIHSKVFEASRMSFKM